MLHLEFPFSFGSASLMNDSLIHDDLKSELFLLPFTTEHLLPPSPSSQNDRSVGLEGTLRTTQFHPSAIGRDATP